MASANGRIIFSEKIVIKLSKDLDEVEDVGVIYIHKLHSTVMYRYLSLIGKLQRREIESLLSNKNNKKSLVEFKEQPICPLNSDTHIYFLHKLDDLTGETSVVKLYLGPMVCAEIYQSKF